MSVKTHCRCEYPEWSSLIRVNSFIKDLNLFFFQRSGLLSTLPNLAVGFCPVGYCPVGFCPSGLLSQWAFVRSPTVVKHFAIAIEASLRSLNTIAKPQASSRPFSSCFFSRVITDSQKETKTLNYIMVFQKNNNMFCIPFCWKLEEGLNYLYSMNKGSWNLLQI